MAKQPHLRVEAGDVHETVLLPGDPDRVDRIADRCTDPTVVAQNREYRLVNARYEGHPLTICSTGIGSPSAAIAAEELARVDATTLLRVGTAGGLQADVTTGDLVVATGAAKEEGTTRRYEADVYPAVPDHAALGALTDAAGATDATVHVGPIATDDAFYAESEADAADWEAAGLLAVEMEAAALFALARRNGLAAGAICTVDGNLVAGSQKGASDDGELPEDARAGVGRAIDVALDAVTRL
ncbi:MAG: nucleoside phosphorylase [Halobacteriaceae archaeon]